jgi:2-isopropylmalate synthase
MADMVKIFDTTLRDGEQSPGASMNTAEKLRLATQLGKAGHRYHRSRFSGRFRRRFRRGIPDRRQTEKHVEVAGLARANKHDIDCAWGAIRHAAKPRIHTFLATSDIHMKYKLQDESGAGAGRSQGVGCLCQKPD